MNKLIFAGMVFVANSVVPAAGLDWPQWQGPNRNGISQESGLLKEWPEGGPPLAWKKSGVGGGYGAPAVVQGRLYGMSKIDEKDEVVWARSEKDGSEIWSKKIAAAEEGGMRQGIEGAGCTPTVDGDRLYVLGHGGTLACLKTGDGEIVWQRNLIKEFGGRLPTWRFNESPLVDGDKVICTPGGIEATLLALDKMTGKEVWRTTVPDQAGAISVPSAPEKSDDDEEVVSADFDPEVLVPAGSKWKYFDQGDKLGEDWMKHEFDDAAWSEGAAELGYGDRDEKTRISRDQENYPTYYFRQQFEVKEPGELKPLILRLLRDDGAVVYLNGKEVLRDNMPKGAIDHKTYAESVTPSERGFYVHSLDVGKLVKGKNLLAVEVHQASAESSDTSFNLELREKVPGKDRLGSPPPDQRFGGGRSGRGGFGSSGAAYSSAIAIDFGGQRQYVQFTSKALVGVSAKDGKLLWRYDKPANRMGINCATPIFQNGNVFAASAYGNGGGLAKLEEGKDGGIQANEVWFSRKMENHHGGMVILDGAIYGANGGNGGGYLTCLDLKSGEVHWDESERGKRRVKKGSIAVADQLIYYRTEEGAVVLIEPSTEEYRERGRFEQPDRTRQPAWTHPVIAQGKLYIRDQDTLYCYDIRGDAGGAK